MYRVVIVEDESAEMQRLQELLLRYGQENSITFDIRTYTSALTFLGDYQKEIDIVFMDIELPDVNGMEICRRLRKQDTEVMIIFVTNMAQFAVQGYEVEAQDFIVKPVQYSEFSLKLRKALGRLERKNDQCILLQSGGTVSRVNLKELYYVEVAEHTVTYHTETGTIEVIGSLKSAEQMLAGKGFSRCNYCYLVNLRLVREFHDGDVVLFNGETLRVSRNRRKEFLQALAEFYMEA